MGRHVMTEAGRDLRRGEFLDAARTLFRERGDLPSVAEIAKAAGLAKGTVYLYFATKEEIFVALLEEEFEKLFVALSATLEELPPEPALASSQFARTYTETLFAQPDLLPLAALANAVLEQNLPLEAMRRFKTQLAMGLVTAGRRLESLVPGLATEDSPHAGETLLLRTYAMTLGLWQALAYPKALLPILNDPTLLPLNRQFTSEIEGTIESLWRGELDRARLKTPPEGAGDV
jgi:AcrR family transcriptional regulator